MLTSVMPSAWCSSCETFILRSVRCWRLPCPRRGVLCVKRLSYGRWDVDVCHAFGVVFFVWNVYLTVGVMLTSAMPSAWCSSCETFISRLVRCWRLLCPRRGVLHVKLLSYGRCDVDVCHALGVVFFVWNVYLTVGEMLTSAMPSAWCSSCETFILRSVRCCRLPCPRRGVLHVKLLSYGRWDVDLCYALGVVFFVWNVYLIRSVRCWRLPCPRRGVLRVKRLSYTVGEMLTSAMPSAWCSSCETFILYGRWDVDVCHALGVVFFVWNVYLIRSVRCWRLLCPRRGVLHVKRLSYGRWDVDVCHAIGVGFFVWNVYLTVGEMLTSVMPSAWCSLCETFILRSVRCWRLLCPRRGVLCVKRLSSGWWDVDLCYALGVGFFVWNVYLTVGEMLPAAVGSLLLIRTGVGAGWRRERNRCDGNIEGAIACVGRECQVEQEKCGTGGEGGMRC